MSDDEEVLVITLGGLTLTAQSYQAAHGSAVRLTIEPLARGPQARVPPVASSSSTSLPRAQYPGSSSTARAPLLADFFEVPTSEVCPAEVLLRASVLEPGGGLSAAQRILRAWNLGRGAARFLRGEAATQFKDPLTLRNFVYVVLSGAELAAPFWTTNLHTYYRAVRLENSVEWNPCTCSQAFPSQEEARVFCLGAGLLGLPACR